MLACLNYQKFICIYIKDKGDVYRYSGSSTTSGGAKAVACTNKRSCSLRACVTYYSLHYFLLYCDIFHGFYVAYPVSLLASFNAGKSRPKFVFIDG